jgi:hypothetical protein
MLYRILGGASLRDIRAMPMRWTAIADGAESRAYRPLLIESRLLA